ncbi:hypothetical protein [Ottowia oryzae]|uniref:hypothetical protein n=1 Tax=Ottowia oryzae TaxID=2109914 RepID=UPI000F4E3086|nr:hypothetical protein [Ottowia oryzae]
MLHNYFSDSIKAKSFYMARHLKLLTITALSVALLGCAAAPRKIEVSAPFNLEEAKAMLKPGKNSISGSAMMRQAGGGVVTCAGEEVNLVPETEYANQRIGKAYGSTDRGYINVYQARIQIANPPGYLESTLKTRCDPQGKFTFKNVGDGNWFVVTGVIWLVGYSTEGGMLMERISLKGGQNHEIIMTP